MSAAPLLPGRTVGEQAAAEQVFAAERAMALWRLVMVVFNSVVYVTRVEGPGTHMWLARAIVAGALVYASLFYLLQPYRRFPQLLSGWFASAADGGLVLLWIYATGGAASPYFPLMFIAVTSVAFRHPPRIAGLLAAGYAAGYALAAGAPHALGAEVLIRAVYLLIMVILAGLMSRALHDATAHRAALAERVRSASELEQAERRLAEAQAIAHLGSWEWHASDGRVVVSPELHRILGFAPGTAPAMDELTSRVHPDDRTALGASFAAAAGQRAPMALEHRVVLPSGEVRWLFSRGTQRFDAQGSVERILGTSHDVTERKLLEARLQAESRLASLGTLAGGVAHEINNPLMYVLGNLEFVERKLRAPGAPVDLLEEALRDARQGAERVRRIVQDLRSFSREDDEAHAQVGLAEVLDLSVNMTWSEIRHRARLVKDYDATPRLVHGNAARLGQLFVNLLVNAAQAIREGDPERNEIRVRIADVGAGRVAVEVSDTGEGMSSAVRARIFEPFFTTRPLGKATGLGLSICHGIVTAHGGEIEVESGVGSGTKVRVVLPSAGFTAGVGDDKPVNPAGLEPLDAERRDQASFS